MADDLVRLKSPFCVGGILVVSPADSPPGFVDELLKRGFTREDDDDPPQKQQTKRKEPAHHD